MSHADTEKNAAIILARLDSRRFPRKAFSILGNKRLIDWVIDGLIDIPDVMPVLATSTRPLDDDLVRVAKERNIPFFRGSAENVASRVVECIREFQVQYWARINGDSPFVHGGLLREAFMLVKMKGYDFVTNLFPRTYPYGISAEVFSANFFLKEYEKFTTNDHYEHITSYFYQHVSRYNFHNITSDIFLTSDIRLTVDSPKDLYLLNALLKKFPDPRHIKWTDLVQAFQNEL